MTLSPIEFQAWFARHDEVWKAKPWLVVGKGPSFADIGNVDLSEFHVFGLNHVVDHTTVDVAHAIDLEVIHACSETIYRNAGYLVMPWYPHKGHRAGRHSLAELVLRVDVLARMASEGRLLWYNREGWSCHEGAPAVRILGFSAEVPYGLLGIAGVRKVRSIGIDGGTAYADNFDRSDLLANRRSSFERQFDGIARSVMKHGLDAAPLGVDTPVRIYVALTEEQLLSAKVLRYSIQKHASVTTEVVFMHEADVEIPVPVDRRNWPRTPFSFQRLLIPQLAGRQGRAIYLDSDMQVFGDVRELWQTEFDDAQLLSVLGDSSEGRAAQYSVMLLDCEALNWDIREIVSALDNGLFTYEDLMQRMIIAERQDRRISQDWNSLEKYEAGKTRLLHYTDMDTQPWVYSMHPLGHVWMSDLIEAVGEGVVSIEEIDEHAAKGWVRPSLPHQVRLRCLDSVLLPGDVQKLDRAYQAPYRKLQYRRPGLAGAVARYGRAYYRKLERSIPDLAALRRLKRRFRM